MALKHVTFAVYALYTKAVAKFVYAVSICVGTQQRTGHQKYYSQEWSGCCCIFFLICCLFGCISVFLNLWGQFIILVTSRHWHTYTQTSCQRPIDYDHCVHMPAVYGRVQWSHMLKLSALEVCIFNLFFSIACVQILLFICTAFSEL